jgi:hypothetical protein
VSRPFICANCGGDDLSIEFEPEERVYALQCGCSATLLVPAEAVLRSLSPGMLRLGRETERERAKQRDDVDAVRRVADLCHLPSIDRLGRPEWPSQSMPICPICGEQLPEGEPRYTVIYPRTGHATQFHRSCGAETASLLRRQMLDDIARGPRGSSLMPAEPR